MGREKTAAQMLAEIDRKTAKVSRDIERLNAADANGGKAAAARQARDERMVALARAVLDHSLRYSTSAAGAIADAKQNGPQRALRLARDWFTSSDVAALIETIDVVAAEGSPRRFGPGGHMDEGREIPAFRQTPTQFGRDVGPFAGSEVPTIQAWDASRQRVLDLRPNAWELQILGAARVACRLCPSIRHNDAVKWVQQTRPDWMRAARGMSVRLDRDDQGSTRGELPEGARWALGGDPNPTAEFWKLIGRNLSDNGEDLYTDPPMYAHRHQ